MNKEQSYSKIKEVVQAKLNYYEKVQNMFPKRSRTERKELKDALVLLEELYGKK